MNVSRAAPSYSGEKFDGLTGSSSKLEKEFHDEEKANVSDERPSDVDQTPSTDVVQSQEALTEGKRREADRDNDAEGSSVMAVEMKIQTPKRLSKTMSTQTARWLARYALKIPMLSINIDCNSLLGG